MTEPTTVPRRRKAPPFSNEFKGGIGREVARLQAEVVSLRQACNTMAEVIATQRDRIAALEAQAEAAT